jgi:hypothetical protein
MPYNRNTVPSVCAQCERNFMGRRGDTPRFCSHACKNLNQIKRVPRTCLNCQVNFVVKPSDVKEGRGRYCTVACANRARSAASLVDALWSRVTRGDGCWEWTGTRDDAGYGKFEYLTVTYRVHRLSWSLENGSIPDGLLICHNCDNPPCVRPDHLFLGTQQDNVDDMWDKGRAAAQIRRS